MKKRAILLTENTTNLLTLAEFLIKDNWEIISTGQTAKFLKSNSIKFTEETALEEKTRYNSDFTRFLFLIMNSKKSNEFSPDLNSQLEYENSISLVCANIEPKYKNISLFLEDSSLENPINLKTISLIRASAKNYSNVMILTDPEDYQEAIIQLKTENIENKFRLYLAGKALNLTSAYDASCSNSILFQTETIDFPNYLVLPQKKQKKLTQGSNSHQAACLYSLNLANSALSGMRKIQGKEIDLNIIKEVFAAWNILSLFLKIIKNPFEVPSQDCSGYSYSTQFTPAAGSVFSIGVKYGNPIGAALGHDVTSSFTKTFNCAPESFEGATLGCSAVIDEKAAEKLKDLKITAIIAPDFTKEARNIFSQNKQIRLIVTSTVVTGFYETIHIDGGVLVQTCDQKLFEHWKVVTQKRPNQAQIDAMAFGTMLSLGAKSDSAIIINDSAAIGISFGQPNRKKAIQFAIEDAKECFKNNLTTLNTNAEILVSDSSIFFEEASMNNLLELGVKAIIQTGGSSTDQQLIDFCNEHEISMVFTGIRHVTF